MGPWELQGHNAIPAETLRHVKQLPKLFDIRWTDSTTKRDPSGGVVQSQDGTRKRGRATES